MLQHFLNTILKTNVEKYVYNNYKKTFDNFN